MPLEYLPSVDEQSVDVAAAPDVVFDVVRARFAGFLSGRLGTVLSRLWGCDPPNAFAVVSEERPHLVVVAGKHRFSRYGIVFRIAARAAGSTLSAETRAEFPGVSGRAYRALVIGTGGHVVATRRMLRSISAAAQSRD